MIWIQVSDSFPSMPVSRQPAPGKLFLPRSESRSSEQMHGSSTLYTQHFGVYSCSATLDQTLYSPATGPSLQ